jgi:hypothetical protein
MIVFNGEIYNFKTIRAELVQSFNETFHGTSDTEIMLSALEQWGLDGLLSRIQGMFAFGLVGIFVGPVVLAVAWRRCAGAALRTGGSCCGGSPWAAAWRRGLRRTSPWGRWCCMRWWCLRRTRGRPRRRRGSA